MASSFATNGLGEFNLPKAEINSIGGTAATVTAVCDNLYNYASNLDGFIEDLITQKDAILIGWEGEAADEFQAKFPKLIEEFMKVPESIRSIANWATTTMELYEKRDRESAANINGLIGGGR